MFVTAEVLISCNISSQWLDFFKENFPKGVEMVDLINHDHISVEFLHWLRKHLFNENKDLMEYYAKCEIVNSSLCWQSEVVSDSTQVVNSKNIKNSKSVFGSFEIINSIDIVDSENIENSQQIFYSSMVDTSNKIIKGQNIVESTNICNSTMVAHSVNVIDSNTVFDSSEIIQCNTATNSYFCQDCTNIKNCMFCEGLENVEYHIFNKPVDEKMYKLFEKQYKKYLTETLSFVRDWPSEMLVNQHVAPTRKFDDWYHPISERFWKWARTLPGYDDMLLYNITMLPKILIDKS